MTCVLPHSSASGWECWVEASAHKPPSSSPPLMDLTEPGHSRAVDSPRECLAKNTRSEQSLHSCDPRCY